MRQMLLPKVKILFIMGVFTFLGYVQTAISAQTAVIATAASDYSSGAHAVISVDKVDGHRAVAVNLDPAGSDQKMIAYGGYFYRFERSNANSITKYDINDPSTFIWQFSTDGDEANSNPHDLVFVNAHKAYLIRYGSSKIWIVDPSVAATDEAGFKIGEINMSTYNDDDGNPEIQAGVIVGNMLFIVIQRVDLSGGWGNFIYNTSYVAVINTDTDTETDTGKGEGGLKGIPISGDIRNPGDISYVSAAGKLYVLCLGDWNEPGGPVGGIVSIDPSNFAEETILPDNADTFGAVTGMAILNTAKGYFIGYAGWGDNSLYSFNPSTGGDITPISGFTGKSLPGQDDGLVIDENDMLWVCNQTDHRVDILNTGTDVVDESIDTTLNPQNIEFAEGSPDIEGFPSGGGSGGGCFISILSH